MTGWKGRVVVLKRLCRHLGNLQGIALDILRYFHGETVLRLHVRSTNKMLVNHERVRYIH